MEQALTITDNLVRFNWQDSTTKHIGDSSTRTKIRWLPHIP